MFIYTPPYLLALIHVFILLVTIATCIFTPFHSVEDRHAEDSFIRIPEINPRSAAPKNG